MEFALDADQVELQETVRRFFADRFPLDGRVDREGAPLDRAVWAELGEMGVLGLLAPDSGLSVIDAALVFELVGANLVPGPLLWTVLAAPLGEGDLVVGGVDSAAVVDDTAVVEHAADLDLLLVLHDDRVEAFRSGDLGEPTPLDPFDPLTPVGRVSGIGAGEVVGDRGAADRLRLLGTVLSAAALTGIATQALDTARDYALEREQFGVPIGSFQAVKHLLADRYVAVVLAQSATYAAAAVIDDPGSDDPARAVAGAKLLAAEAAIDGASTAIQVLGGMGFTWEMLPHHLLKRAWLYEQGFGRTDDHAGALGAALLAAAG